MKFIDVVKAMINCPFSVAIIDQYGKPVDLSERNKNRNKYGTCYAEMDVLAIIFDYDDKVMIIKLNTKGEQNVEED